MAYSLNNDWKVFFTKEQLQEGNDYFLQGKAKKPSEDDDGFSAIVRGAQNYRIRVSDVGEGIDGLACTCSRDASDFFCPHMAAALFLLEDVYEDWDFYPSKAYLQELKELGWIPPASGNTAAVKKTMKSAAASTPSAAKRAAGHTGDKQAAADLHRESLGFLSELSREYLRQREDSARGEGKGGEDLASYRYFDTEAIRKGLKISPSVMRSAQSLTRNGELGGIQISAGIMQAGDYIPYALRKNPNKLVDHISPQMRLKVIQQSRNRSWYVEQTYNWNTLESSECSNWSCRMRKYDNSLIGHVLCPHEVATLLHVEQYLSEHNIGDGTSQNAEQLIRDFRGGAGSAQLVEESETAQPLTMNPQVRIDENRKWFVQFQIGTKRLYKIKDLPGFVDRMDHHETQAYGKNTVLKLGREYLLENSRRWMRFIDHALATIRMNYGLGEKQDVYFYSDIEGWTRLTDRIPLFGEVLDSFIEEAGSSLIEAERAPGRFSEVLEKEKFTFRARDGHLTPRLICAPWYREGNGRFEGLKVTGELSPVFRGAKYGYYLENDALIRLSPDELRRLDPLLRSAGVTGSIHLQIGRAKLTEFYHSTLPELKAIADVQEDRMEEIEAFIPEKPECVCYLDVDEDCVLCRPYVYYGTAQHSPFDVYKWEARTAMAEHYRDEAAETRLMRLLEAYLPERDYDLQLFLTARGELPLYEFLDHGLSQLMELAQVHATDRFLRLKVRSSVPFEAGVSVKSGVMDLSLTSDELSPEELKQVFEGYRKKLTFIRLKNGDFLKLEQNEELLRLIELMNTLQVSPKEFAKGKMHIPVFRALYLDQMLEQMDSVYAERDSHFKKLIKEFKTISDADYEVPYTLKNTLRKYQKTGYRWLRTLDEYHFGGILADDMGLGKTLQAISVLLAAHNEIDMTDGEAAEVLPSLIVCPASLIYNWEEELHRFAPSLSVAVIAGSAEERRRLLADSREANVLVTSYDLLKRDIAEYEDLAFRFEIIDEAQYIKNHSTAAAKSVKLIRARARFALTGTPIENRLSELWSIFDYLMPGFLYDYTTFRREFELPIVKDQNGEALDRLRKMVTPFILRRAKREVLKDLPDKLEEVRYAGFEAGGQQQKLYNAQVVRMKEDLRAQTDEDFRNKRIEILSELMRIRQICCDPSLCFENYQGDSAKREACMELIRSVIDGEHKALVFSQFTSMLALIEEDLKAAGIDYYVITGATPKEKRVKMANAFNKDSVPVFLISLKAGGTGLNLTGADVVIHYDPWWNAAVQNQATDRAHRIGQDKVVTVYQLILRGTIEERIMEMQNTKRALADDILSSDAVSSAAISRDELLELLG